MRLDERCRADRQTDGEYRENLTLAVGLLAALCVGMLKRESVSVLWEGFTKLSASLLRLVEMQVIGYPPGIPYVCLPMSAFPK